MEAVKDVEKRMGPLALHELSKNTEERLTSLNSLAEHVTHKTKLETEAHDRPCGGRSQQVERAGVVDGAQIAKLNEGNKQIATEENWRRKSLTRPRPADGDEGQGRVRARDCASRKDGPAERRFAGTWTSSRSRKGIRDFRSAPARPAGFGGRSRRTHGIARLEGRTAQLNQCVDALATRYQSCLRKATS